MALRAIECYREAAQDSEDTRHEQAEKDELAALRTLAESRAFEYTKHHDPRDVALHAQFAALEDALRRIDENAHAREYLKRARTRADWRGGPLGNDPVICDILSSYAFAEAALCHERPIKSLLDDAIDLGEYTLTIVQMMEDGQAGRVSPQFIERARKTRDQVRKQHIGRLVARYRFFGDPKDFTRGQELFDEKVLMQEATPDAYRTLLMGMRLYEQRWKRTRESAWMDKARKIAVEIIGQPGVSVDTKASAIDALANIQRGLRDYRAAIVTIEDFVERDVQLSTLKDTRALLRRALHLLDRLRVEPTSPARDGWLRELDDLAELGVAPAPSRELRVVAGLAHLRAGEPGAALSQFERGISNARAVQATCVSRPDKLASARYYKDFASLAGFASVRTCEFERGYQSIENSISSVLRAADDKASEGGAPALSLPAEHRFGYVGTTELGSFLLWHDGKGWHGLQSALDEETLRAALNMRFASDAEVFPILAPPQRASDARYRGEWLRNLLVVLESSGFAGMLATAFSGARSVTIVPLGIARSVPLHEVRLAQRRVFAGVRVSYSLSARPGKPLGRKTARVVTVAHPCPEHGDDPSIAYFTESIGSEPGAETTRWEAASAEAFSKTAPGARILRVGSHASFVQESPLSSYFDLVGGPMEVEKLLDIDFTGTALAILTCCDSGKADSVVFGDEGIGITGAFLHGGAQFVASGMWEVSALVATLLDHKLFELAKDGQTSIPESFERARASMLTLDLHGWVHELAQLRERLESVPTTTANGEKRKELAIAAVDDITARLRGPRGNELATALPQYVAPFVLTHLGAAPPE